VGSGNSRNGAYPKTVRTDVGPVELVREHIRDIGQRLVAEHGEALEILANHDPDAPRQ
jgi:hypothetical protein